ncbi:MAG: hypothetical protein HYV63_14650 [Candidatus Schekmanbacteria bacterium]|nr:hypothetical protein [Candidatus Schekmanbacteria bacterium]
MRLKWTILYALVLLSAGRANATGSVTAEADQLLGIAQLRAETGLTGKGVKVAVIGPGITDWQERVASGDLPSDLWLIDDYAGTDYRTLGVIETIHDLAPEATLMFGALVNALGAVPQALAAGADIIVATDDVPFLSVFEDEPRNKAFQDAAQGGTLVIAPAGNFGVGHYRGTFKDAGDNHHDFGSGVTRIPITVPALREPVINLNWAEDVYTNAFSNYVLRVYTATGEWIGDYGGAGAFASVAVQYADQTNDYGLLLSVWREPGAPDLPFDLFVQGWPWPVSADPPQLDALYQVARGSIAGIGALPEVFTVGALDQTKVIDVPNNIYAIRDYSSHGPAEVLLASPVNRQKPDLMAPDCQTGYGGTPWCGAAISAGVVGGVAALLQQKYHFERTIDMKQQLTSTADDLGATGYDYETGYGQINPRAALTDPLVPVRPVALFVLLVLFVVLFPHVKPKFFVSDIKQLI